MDNQRSSDDLFPRPFSQQRLISGLALGFMTLCLTATTFAQSYSPSAIPAVPDARKPGRNIQPSQPSPTQPPAAQPPATTPPIAQPPATPPVGPATTWSNEGLFSQSTQFAFELQPANHPKMPSIDQLMQTSVTLLGNFQRVAFCPKNNRLISLCGQSFWLFKLSNLF